MKGKTTDTVYIGKSKYEPGTTVEINPLYTGTRDECYWVVFPGGEGGYLGKHRIRPNS